MNWPVVFLSNVLYNRLGGVHKTDCQPSLNPLLGGGNLTLLTIALISPFIHWEGAGEHQLHVIFTFDISGPLLAIKPNMLKFSAQY